jgi:hypothetical protein
LLSVGLPRSNKNEELILCPHAGVQYIGREQQPNLGYTHSVNKQSPISPKMIKFLASLCACFCFSQTMLAWNAEGHIVAAQIAYNHLDSAVKAKCDAVVAVPLAYGG